MKYNIYKVESINEYKNKGNNLEYDYSKDFENIKKYRGYIKIDYIITDSELEIEKIYFNGNLIKPIKKISSFEEEQIKIINYKEKEYDKSPMKDVEEMFKDIYGDIEQ